VEAHKLGLPSAERSAGTDKLLSAAKKALKGVAASVIAPEVAAATGAGAPAGGAVVPPKKKHKRKVRVLCVCAECSLCGVWGVGCEVCGVCESPLVSSQQSMIWLATCSEMISSLSCAA
jgi:hypothetical protein